MEKELDPNFFSHADRLRASASETDFLTYSLLSAITAVFLERLETNEFAKPAPVVKEVVAHEAPTPVVLPEIPFKNSLLTVVPTPER